MKTIFILGHMRSRSSLLAHLILSNKNFVGMGESNATYKSFGRVHYMKLKSLGINNAFSFFSRRFVDQINHNHKTPNWELLMSSNIKLIVLVRNPIDSISSIKSLTAKHYEAWDDEKCNEYYINRLNFLDKVCKQKDNSDLLVINSDALITDTKKSLQRVSTFLNLADVLKEEYVSMSFTGIKGDPSEKILEGRILSDEKISSLYEDQDDLPSIRFKKFVEDNIQ